MKITIVGCGNMGLIYARSFLKYNIVSKDDLLLVEKSETRKEDLKKLDIGRVVVPDDKLIAGSDVIILSVKPQDFVELAADLKKVLNEKTILLSIMAGINIAFLQQKLNHQKIVRAMPNSPVEIGMGITAYSLSKSITIEQAHKVENLLTTTGRTLYMEDENLLDAVTALSGSGPAYFFYFVQQLIEAGKKMGMDEATSSLLVKQTMLGSFHLINNAGKPLDELIKAVTSKGGTTEAALSTFAKHNVSQHLQEGLLNAEERAKELAEQASKI
ncbi:MAG TPA: pyrroline-5-carboxylate reductase [Bacteroidia bacterium]|jgi:pyrroline-5-carboxylate reductase|nr:pyrroline-5-carboxylate reductase [Bacteroidia bacterium]